MRVLVTGARGQLGQELLSALEARGHAAIGTDLPVDLGDPDAVRDLLNQAQPEAVLHAAAYTAVDAAQAPKNREMAWRVNVEGTRHVAEACRRSGAKLLYLSTDYVFSGEGTAPWRVDCEAFAPVNFYGQTKLAGERIVRTLPRAFVVRIAWLFGPSGKNFVETMLRLSKTHEAVSVVCDQIGTPTYAPDLAPLLCEMIEGERYGVYHATNEGGFLSWADFAAEIFRQAGRSTRVIPVTSAQYASAAPRPKNSRLDKQSLTEAGFSPLPPWQDALARYLAHAHPTRAT